MRLTHPIGSFAISREIIENKPEAVKKLMGKCIITRCEFIYPLNILEYIALSNCFKEVRIGDKIPKYLAIISNNEAYFKPVEEHYDN